MKSLEDLHRSWERLGRRIFWGDCTLMPGASGRRCVARTAMTSRLCWYNSASMAGCPRNGPVLFFNAFHMWFDWIPDWDLWNATHVQLSWLLSFTGRRLVACMLPRMRAQRSICLFAYGSEKTSLRICLNDDVHWVAGWMLESCWRMLVASKRVTFSPTHHQTPNCKCCLDPHTPIVISSLYFLANSVCHCFCIHPRLGSSVCPFARCRVGISIWQSSKDRMLNKIQCR